MNEGRPYSRWLTAAALALAGGVVVLGAWVRLSHAGLACPDWPGCYGRPLVPEQAVAEAHDDYASRPLDEGKAWREMLHRYAAGLLGVLILALAAQAWRRDQRLRGSATAALVLVLFQALLGMWTVTLLLKPLVVVAHLLGGMVILALLCWMWLGERAWRAPGQPAHPRVARWAGLGLTVLFAQIALGGWTSSHYAALACPDFPTCQGRWWPDMDFRRGFQPWHGLGIDYEGGILPTDARVAVHMAHRLGAVITLLVLGGIALGCLRRQNTVQSRRIGGIMLALLCLQWALGIANVMLRLPLPVATAHNAVAALLVLTLVALLHSTRSAPPGRGAR